MPPVLIVVTCQPGGHSEALNSLLPRVPSSPWRSCGTSHLSFTTSRLPPLPCFSVLMGQIGPFCSHVQQVPSAFGALDQPSPLRGQYVSGLTLLHARGNLPTSTTPILAMPLLQNPHVYFHLRLGGLCSSVKPPPSSGVQAQPPAALPLPGRCIPGLF